MMLFSSLYSIFLWGGTASMSLREDTSPRITDATEYSSTAPESVELGSSGRERSPSGKRPREPAESVLSPYFYQNIGMLQNLRFSQALALALEELADPSGNPEYEKAIQKLRAREKPKGPNREYDARNEIDTDIKINIKKKQEYYEALQAYEKYMKNNEYDNAKQACDTLITIAPLKGYELSEHCESAFGEIAKAEAAAKKYQEISEELTAWAEELVMKVNNER